MDLIESESHRIRIPRIVSTVLHQINIEDTECNQIAIPNDDSDLENYLTDLLNEIHDKPQKRAYDFHRETTEFFTTLRSYFSEQNLTQNSSSTNLANRLLDKEIETDDRYGHLSSTGTGHVKKGSFLQFIYRNGTDLAYLGVKIEHQSFLDESDFKKKIGLSLSKKIYKACKVSFNGQGLPYDVFVYDTNSKPSTYWWKDFLELKEVRDDALNTKTASKAVISEINRLKDDHPIDHTILRNSAIGAFKQQGQMNYDEFLKTIFENYEPEDTGLKIKLPDFVNKLRALPEKKKFDTCFNLVPSEVPFKRTKMSLSKEISLTYEDGIENLDEKIWAEKTANGRKLVVIDSPKGFENFTLKERI
ncbi:MAG: hypothetical protein CTY16_01340 [Methylobacter sp.]|nr:MAG: hypothetical protein CTY16_01340 [Methylobacter sp.]